MNQLTSRHMLSGAFCRKIVVFLCVICGFFQLPAQKHEDSGEGKVSGRIVDSVSGQPVEYASVSLAREADKKEINGTTTDDKGLFELQNIPEGTYRLVVYFVGYQTGVKSNIVISKANPVVFVKDFRLSNRKSTLKEVTVTAEKSLIENKIDKLVYNAENDLTSQGGVATDILKKVPQVTVDVDGNVELQGNSNIRFLINGKPSTIFGNNLVDVLASIPASQISSIEVITSPGAKYDAEGTGGIINIILKKSTAQGFNGNVSLSAGTRLENGSLNLNARKGHFGVRGFFSGNAQLNSRTLNSQNRLSQDPAAMQSTSLIQDGTGQFTRNGFQTGGGFDWDINSKNTISGAITYNHFGINSSGLLNRQTNVMDASGNTISRITDNVNNESDGNGRTFDWDLNYKKTFNKEGQELEASVNSSASNSLFHYQQSQAHLPGDTVFNASYGNNPGTERQTEFVLNYVQPLKEDMELETGLKTTLHHITSNSDVFLLNTGTGNYDYSNSQSMSFIYDRNVYAGYASLSFKLFHFLDVKAGGRYEYTADKANFSNAGEVTYTPYSTVVPSLALSRKLNKDQVIKLSYSHRIERPDYHDLNPFLNAADPRNISTGNVNLRPEQSDKIELGYSKSFEKGSSLNITLFARLNTDDIQSYTRFYPSFKVGDSTYSNVSVTYRENIGHENNLGANIFVNIPIAEKITLRSNISGFERYIITGLPGGGDVHGFNYRINMNASYQVSPSFALEAFGNFNSPRINAQGTNPSFTTYTFAFRKQFFHKKGSVALTATNPFSEYIDQRTVLAGQNFTTTSDRQLPYRSFGINLTWKFGKMEFKRQRDSEDNNNIPEPPSGS